MKSPSSWPWKWIALALAVMALIVAVKFLPVADWLNDFNQWIKGFGTWGVILYVGLYALATVFFLPGWILTVGAGVAFGLLWGTVAALCGATIGATLAFLIARYAARSAVSKRFARNKKFTALDQAIGDQGWKMIGLLRLSPLIPFNLSNYLYGLTAIRLLPYIVASFFGMLPGTLLYVYLGTIGKIGIDAASARSAKSPLEYWSLALGLLATLIVTIFLTRLAQRALKSEN
ncbi:MAG: TVP38/TMEM64 family protein [Verrucomicrobiota bacterium]|nr:TVP38/TMEM64 family protein [Verrucomicrobiota bacterium]